MSRRPPQRDRVAPPRSRHKSEPSKGPFRAPSPEVTIIYGVHAVREALRSRRRKLLDIYVAENTLPRIADFARAAGLEPRIVDARDLSRRLGEDTAHQGLMLEARPLPEADIGDIETRSGLVLALDQITDPQNVGAILRSACAFGVDALIVTERHSPEFAGALAKTASGALEHVTIVSVVNLVRALDDLRERGYCVVGLDSEGADSIDKMTLTRPLTLVLGAEGKGLRRLTRERCDSVARLDLPGPIKSLNVSNACAAALSLLRLRFTQEG